MREIQRQRGGEGGERKEKRKIKGGREKGLEYSNSDIDQETEETGKSLRVLSVPLCNLSLVSDSHVRKITTTYNSLHL